MTAVSSPNVISVNIEPASDIKVIVEPLPEIVVVTVAEQGPPGIQGIQGPSGSSSIGGHPVGIEDPQEGDLIVFAASGWVNEKKEKLSDGGNF